MALTDKLGIFVEDMRRGGVDCLPPDINASHAHLHRRGRRRPLCPRRAEGRRREGDGGAGRGARTGRAVRQPRGFRCAHRSAAAQSPPARKPRRRGRVRRDQARTCRGLRRAPRRSSPMRRARTSSARAARPACSASSTAEAAPIRLPRDASWTLAQRMAAERDAFGFYFSAHPVDASRHLLAAHKVETFAELADVRDRRGRADRRDAWPALVEDSALADLGQGPPLHDGDAERQFGPVRRDRVRRRRDRGAGSCREGRSVRLARRRARPPRGRRDPASHDQALPAAQRPCQANAAADDRAGAGRRVADRIVRELADSRAAQRHACASSCRWRQAERRSSSPAATSRSTRELAARIERITGEGSVDLSVQEPPKLALVG